MSRLESKQRWGLGIGGILLTLLLAAVFTLGSLDVPFKPKNWRDVMVLYAVSSFVTAALLVFLLILGRTTLRLWVERRREQLGARFKTKMVVGAMALSLLPIVFMFIVSYSLINRSLLLWFPEPLEIASEETQKLLNDLGRAQLPRLRGLALQVQSEAQRSGDDFLQHAFAKGADAVWILDQNGRPIRGGMVCDNQAEDRRGTICVEPNVSGKFLRSLQSGVEVWQAGGRTYFGARVPNLQNRKPAGFTVAAFRTSPDVLTCFSRNKLRSLFTRLPKARAKSPPAILIIKSRSKLKMNLACWFIPSTP